MAKKRRARKRRARKATHKLPPTSDDIRRINVEHQSVVEASQGALAHAIACGEMLKAAKGKVKHGEWEKWLLENCPDISDRTARNYMWCAKNAPELEKAAGQNGSTVADLSVRGATKLLSKSQTPEQKAARAPKAAEVAVPAPAPSVSAPACGPDPVCTALNEVLPMSEPDDVFEVLKEEWDDKKLAELAGLLAEHLKRAEPAEVEDADLQTGREQQPENIH